MKKDKKENISQQLQEAFGKGHAPKGRVREVMLKLDAGWNPTLQEVAEHFFEKFTIETKGASGALMFAVRKKYFKIGKLLYNDTLTPSGSRGRSPGRYSVRDLDDESINLVNKRGEMVKNSMQYLHKIPNILARLLIYKSEVNFNSFTRHFMKAHHILNLYHFHLHSTRI